MDASLTRPAADRPAPTTGAGPWWKGLPRRHPAAVTAERIRHHIDRYVTGRPIEDDPSAAAALLDAAALLEIIAEQEPNR